MIDKSRDTRFVCGRNFDGTFTVVELRGRVTGCYFFIDKEWDGGKSHRAAQSFLDWSARPRLTSSKLHVNRAGAIESMRTKLTAEQAKCRTRADEISGELFVLNAL